MIILVIAVATMSGTVREMADAEPGRTHTLAADQDYWIMSGDGSTSQGSCSVYDPNINSVPVNVNPNTSASTTLEDQTWNMVGTFTSTDAGEYSVYCSDLSSSSTYVVEANMGGIVGGVLGILGAILLGGLLFLVGVVLIIVNRVTASRRRRAAGMG